jgi:hypothetical protein
MTWQNILKREKYQPKNASSLAIIYLEDELNNTYDGAFAGRGFIRHALELIADAMKEGKSDEEIRNMLNEKIPDRLERDRVFLERLESHGFTFKDINFSEVIKESLDPEIKYLSHLRR